MSQEKPTHAVGTDLFSNINTSPLRRTVNFSFELDLGVSHGGMSLYDPKTFANCFAVSNPGSSCGSKPRFATMLRSQLSQKAYTYSWDGSSCKYQQKVLQSQSENNLVRTIMYSPKSIARGSEGGKRAVCGRETASSDRYDIVNMIKGGWRKGSFTRKNPLLRRQSRHKMEA